MGFFDTLGNMFGDITGANQANTAKDQERAGSFNQKSASRNLEGISDRSANQYATEAGQAGQALGNQMGQQAATMGTQAATQAARTAGLNKGQAALEGGQQAGSLYSQGQMQGQGLGMGAYGQGASTQLQGATAQGNLGSSQMGEAGQQQQAGNAATGGLFNALGGLFSDEKTKEDIKPAYDIDEIMNKVDPIRFKYKKEMEQGSGEHIGITAQDMEKTPLKENVMDTSMGKMINPGKQENSNLNLIVQLASKIKELEGKKNG